MFPVPAMLELGHLSVSVGVETMWCREDDAHKIGPALQRPTLMGEVRDKWINYKVTQVPVKKKSFIIVVNQML